MHVDLDLEIPMTSRARAPSARAASPEFPVILLNLTMDHDFSTVDHRSVPGNSLFRGPGTMNPAHCESLRGGVKKDAYELVRRGTHLSALRAILSKLGARV